MHVLIVTNNLVRLNFVGALLRDAGIESQVLDGFTSAMEGSIGAIPRRLVVAAADRWRAERVLAEADVPE